MATMMLPDLGPLWLTFKLATITTIILVAIGIPLAWVITVSRRRFKYALEALVSMPLVLPPTVLGFYLLVILGPQGVIGHAAEAICGSPLIFSFPGLVIGSVIFSLPFMVNPLKAGFDNVPVSLIESAQTLGKTPWEILWKVFLPNSKPALWAGVVMAFIHTVGEFGVVLMIGGNIPGKTKVISMAIYEEVESLNFVAANQYAWILAVISFTILFCFYVFNRRIKVF